MEKLYIVMPAYNESENIRDTIGKWYDVIEKINKTKECKSVLAIANDGSKDNTFEVMQSVKNECSLQYFEPITKANGGHGQTVLFLYRHAIANGADYIFQTDSDGQTDPNEFWEMFNRRHEYDFQIGYRQGRQDGMSRIFVTKVLRLVVWFMFHEWVTDANTPFRLMERVKLKRVMEMIPQDYFLCNVAISAIAVKWRYKIRFQNITFKPRQGGVNSINMKRILKIGWKAIGDFRKINANIKNRPQ